ncbi:VanZ family protein [Aquibacillus koreensis]|uniref:VanZ family protein n=1 Tax=Aquibacillus koreensis TaxID=279446 RepID=A0A9X3WQJ1_9BACI|nr:VanZ family protein [Aquibacillus koreensis]MCT2537241.1 VanZ family protein [Aquibacillus koreensis]MDC3421589.1 VanZ family protein [Aquibacillus koreensis]
MKKWLYWLLPFTWMGVIFYASAQPYQNQDIKPFLSSTIDLSFLTPYLEGLSFTYHQSEVSIATLGVNGVVEFFVRKGAHVTVFFILCLAFYMAFRKTTHIKFWRLIEYSLVLTIMYAAIDEIHQGFTPNRTPYIGDVFLDSFGAILAVITIILFQWIKRLRKPSVK